ncbi:MAG: helix-turn-helix domain-containing protein [Lachnospiraceae bacterium]|nr:helix-turn-helix domain-containing protein [Lachnospiraceae bacterium]
MGIHAYDESYITDSQKILGHAVDFAVMTLQVEPKDFGNALAVSNAGKQFASGNPRYIAGMSGCELARLVLTETNTPFTDAEDAMYLDKSPEYWAGWALAFYQWQTGRSFMEILSAADLPQIISMYPVYHEMDITHFTDFMEKMIKEKYPDTRLKTLRLNCGLSQSQLAEDADVALRQIQLFEQRQRDINNAAATTLLKLSRALHCKMEDLME